MGDALSQLWAIQKEREEYAKIAANPDFRVTRAPVLARHKELIRAAVLRYYQGKRKWELSQARKMNAELRDQNLNLSEAHSAKSVEVQRLIARCNELVADAANAKNDAGRWMEALGTAEQRLRDVADLDNGAAELRALLAEANPPADKRGLKAMIGWLVEEIKVLRSVNQARAEAQRTTSPEVQAAIDKIAGSRGLKALAVPTDNITLATIRAWWAITTEEKRRTDAYSVLSEIILPAHERGTTWIGVLWSLRDADVTIGELPMNVGKTGKVDRISAVSARKVTVGTEERGAEWGEGRAAAQFEALRQENARTPLGKRTEHDLKNNIIPLRPESADDLPKAN
jgi:hypothetical protein